jgi:hypothetical protein
VIVYGCAVTDAATYERCAEPGLRRAVDGDPGAELLALTSVGSLFRNYNLLRERVAGRDDLEALVLVHQDAEIVDDEFAAKLRAALSDPEVALVGCAGAVGVRSMAWWEGAVTWASFTHRYSEMGGGEIPAVSWRSDRVPTYARTGEVDAVDGFVLGLSPWAVRNLSFDESLGRHHGYDLDLCLQARAAGKSVVTADLRVIHHHSLELLSDVEGWVEAHMKVADKWEGRIEGFGFPDNGDWRARARRAEADAAAQRLLAGGAGLQRDAAQAELERTRQSTSWRFTAPIRALGSKLRRRR